mgnify:CR=1 FL=1
MFSKRGYTKAEYTHEIHVYMEIYVYIYVYTHENLHVYTHENPYVYTHENPYVYMLQVLKTHPRQKFHENVLLETDFGRFLVHRVGGYRKAEYTHEIHVYMEMYVYIDIYCPVVLKQLFNSDDKIYDGTGNYSNLTIKTQSKSWHYKKESVQINLPPLAVLVFNYQ